MYIDFKPHNIDTEKLYIIPAGHTLYLPAVVADYYSLNLPCSMLNEIEKLWLFRQKYSIDKSIVSADAYLSRLNNSNVLSGIFDSQQFLEKFETSMLYIHQAEKLISFLLDANVCHRMTVKDLADGINISPKTLLRVCNSIFQEKPQHIIRYHLIVKAIVYIICNKMDSLGSIADTLGFKDSGTFTRYIKSYTGLCPKEIRDRHLHILL